MTDIPALLERMQTAVATSNDIPLTMRAAHVEIEKLEQIATLLSDAAQDDCENGVAWINDIAAKNYLKEYPFTLAAIRKIQELIDNDAT